MTRTKGAMRWGGVFAAASAAFHVIALPASGFSADALLLLVAGIVYAGFAYGLLQGWRWLAYIVFVVLFIGTSVAISGIWASGAVPGWLYTSITVANLLCVAALFVALWKSPNRSVEGRVGA